MKAGSKAKALRISSSMIRLAASYIWANDSACSIAILSVGPVGILPADLSLAQGRLSANSGPCACRNGSNESQAASRFRVLLLRFTLRFTLIFLRRCGPFDVLDLVLFFQGIL